MRTYITLEPRYGDSSYRKWLEDRGMPSTLCTMINDRMIALNKRIADDAQLGDAFRVGHSFFCPTGKDFSGLDEVWYREIVDTEIRPLLEEYWQDDLTKARSALELL